MHAPKGITVIIPSVGRELLGNTLASLAPQLQPEDAVVVVTEENNPKIQKLVRRWADLAPCENWTYTHHQGGAWGHPNRNYAMDSYVQTTHVWTLDDDDIATPTAMQSLRDHIDDPWTIFQMTFGDAHFARGLTCWRERRIVAGDIGTPMLFAPLGEARFGHEYMGDYIYATELQTERGDPVWSEDVICIVRPIDPDE